MCCKDVEIAMMSGSSQGSRLVNNAVTPLVAHSDERLALVFLGIDSGTARLGTNPFAGANEGIIITTTSAPICISPHHYGSAPQKAWYAFGSAGNQNVTFIEVFDKTCRKERSHAGG